MHSFKICHFEKSLVRERDFIQVARGYGQSAKSSRASRSASANMFKNRGLAFQKILPLPIQASQSITTSLVFS
jgi:hypothetical protein